MSKEQDKVQNEMPEMSRTQREWLKKNVAPRYMPVRNPDYNAADDARPYPFNDLNGDLTQ